MLNPTFQTGPVPLSPSTRQPGFIRHGKTYLEAAQTQALESGPKATTDSCVSMAAPAVCSRLDAVSDGKPGYPSRETLEKAMANGSVTSKWDMVTSYAIDKLNAVLAENYDNAEAPKSLTFEVPLGFPALGIAANKFTVTLSLDRPTLQFHPEDGRQNGCELTIPITGGTIDGPVSPLLPQREIPPNSYAIKITAPLASIAGSDKTITDQGEVVNFNGDDNDEHKIFFNITKDDRTTCAIVTREGAVPQTDSPFGERNQNAVADALRTYFTETVSGISYELGSIRQSKQQNGGRLLQPERFVLVTQTSGNDAVLSVYMKVAGSENPAGDAHPSFQAGGQPMLPVPQGSDASVIFSRDTLCRLIASSTQSNGAAVKRSAIRLPTRPDDQKAVQITPQHDKIKIDKYHRHKSWAVVYWYSASISEFNIDLNKDPFVLDFSRDGKPNKVHVSWASQTNNILYHWKDFAGTGDYSGHLNVSCAVDKDCSLTLTDSSVALEGAIQPGDYTVQISGEAKDFTTFANRERGAILDQLKTGPQSPSVSLNIAPINFELEKNILFNGRANVKIDTGVGLVAPRDLMLLGTLESSAKK